MKYHIRYRVSLTCTASHQLPLLPSLLQFIGLTNESKQQPDIPNIPSTRIFHVPSSARAASNVTSSFAVKYFKARGFRGVWGRRGEGGLLKTTETSETLYAPKTSENLNTSEMLQFSKTAKNLQILEGPSETLRDSVDLETAVKPGSPLEIWSGSYTGEIIETHEQYGALLLQYFHMNIYM